MFRKFLDGLIFGFGFSISYFVLWYLSAAIVTPWAEEYETPTAAQAERAESRVRSSGTTGALLAEFHEMSVDEKIRNASGIAIARFERLGENDVQAVIQEFLKRDPNTEFFYQVGDALPDGHEYLSMKDTGSVGLVIFFVGSPATIASVSSFREDRIYSLGDMPLDLLRQKAAEAE